MTVLATPEVSAEKARLIDRFGRQFRYVRVSVTDLCNMSCTYCNPVRGCVHTHKHKLSWEDLDFLVDISINDLGAEAIRITGGEPLVRPGLAQWISRIRRHENLRDISLTTNGVLLKQMAGELRAAGLNRVNVSLDTFNPELYASLTRGGNFGRCMEGIETALEYFRPVKLNAVALKDITLNEVERFIAFSHEHRVEVRFIELMPLFDEKEYFFRNFLSVENLRLEMSKLGFELVPEGDGPASGNRTGYGPATTYTVSGTKARIGFISQMSNTKCVSCNKLRLTSDGALKPCLLMPEEIDLAAAIQQRDRETVIRQMRRQFLQRAEKYDAMVTFGQGTGRPMQATGG